MGAGRAPRSGQGPWGGDFSPYSWQGQEDAVNKVLLTPEIRNEGVAIFQKSSGADENGACAVLVLRFAFPQSNSHQSAPEILPSWRAGSSGVFITAVHCGWELPHTGFF